jgi:hypothetical protein
MVALWETIPVIGSFLLAQTVRQAEGRQRSYPLVGADACGNLHPCLAFRA